MPLIVNHVASALDLCTLISDCQERTTVAKLVPGAL